MTLEEKHQIISAARIELSKRNFWEFCLYYDYEFFSKRKFLKVVALAFQYVFEQFLQGKAVKVAVSMPPRAGKSYITSLFCAWWLGKFPELSVMRNTCTATLYRKFSYDVRNIVRTDKYRSVFPSSFLADDKQNLDGWNLKTSKQVGYFGAGVGGTIIGFGANIAISDDLYKDLEDALSETTQEGVSMWKQSAHNSRMEKNCPEIFIGTRWTKNDEIGRATEAGLIDKVIKIPALIDGKSFCEDVKSTEEYLKIKADTDEEIWDAEYQQEPAELKGLLFPKSELKFFNRKHVDLSKAEYKFLYVDPADEGGDFLSAPGCYLIGDRIYVPRVEFTKAGTDITIPDLVEWICTEKIDAVEVEGNSAWILFGKDLRTKVTDDAPIGRGFSDCEIRVIKNTTNKHTRIIAQAAFIKNHFYFDEEYENDQQYKEFIKNMTKYMRDGSSKHEDAPDSMAGCANHFKTKFSHLW
jgi:predicted phage terminase large subunit-like protein